jgi:hypothetical protein
VKRNWLIYVAAALFVAGAWITSRTASPASPPAHDDCAQVAASAHQANPAVSERAFYDDCKATINASR